MARCGDTYARQASSLPLMPDITIFHVEPRKVICACPCGSISIYIYIYTYMDVRMDMKESVCMCKGERDRGKTEKLTSHRPVD